MNRQKSFENDKSTLYLVPTPIGNLSEFSERAKEVLNMVDVIACEDTRTSGQLLKHFDIHKHLIAYQNFNEETSSKGILNLLSQGKDVALISDAGYPLINDPGQRVVTDATNAGYNVVPVSGCCAALNALVASGLVTQPYIFIGFLPQGEKERIKKMQFYANYPMTLVFYEAPHRIEKFLSNLLEVMGNRKICLAREITKLHEEFIRGTVQEVLEIAGELKGEMVIVVEGHQEEVVTELDYGMILDMVSAQRQEGLSTTDAIKAVALATGISKNKVYAAVHKGETN